MPFPKTTTMSAADMSGKKCMLPAGGPRVSNVVSKGNLPTRPAGGNGNMGPKK